MLTLVLAGGLALAAPASDAERGPQAKPFEIITLADGVYGFVWKDPLEDLIEGNSLIVVNESDVLVVDTGNFPSTARRMVAEIERLTGEPVRYVVNTHWHDDHHSGNAVFRERWPGVEFIAHEDTRTDIRERSYGGRLEDLAGIEGQIATLERWIADGVDDAGKPMDERRKQRARAIIGANRWALDELRDVEEQPPDLVFRDRLVLQRGTRTIELLWLGRGNTRGDVVVLLPEERIVATGDLLVYPVPFAFYSYYEDWIGTLAALDGLPADVLFLAHGRPQRDRAYLRQVRGLLLTLVDGARAAAAEGLDLEQVRARLTLPEWRARFAGDDEARGRAFDSFFLAPGVERAFRQATGDPSASSPTR